MKQKLMEFHYKPLKVALVFLILLPITLSITFPSADNICTAQPPSNHFIIYGFVFGPSGQKVSNATVGIQNTETDEIITERTDDNGSYSYNLANFEKGWQDGQKIIISARKITSKSATIFPSSDEGGKEVNISLPALTITTPQAGEEFSLEKEILTVEISYFPSINVTRIEYFVDSIRFANTTATNATLSMDNLSKGLHKLMVKLLDEKGNQYSCEIHIFLKEEEDNKSDYMMVYLLLGVCLSLVLAGGYYRLRKTRTPK